jgi:hypothetical protein
MVNIPDSGYYYYNELIISPGIYQYYIWANDTVGNSVNSEVYQFEIITSNNKITNMTNNWNFVSLPFNQSLEKTDLIVRHNISEYTWQEAVDYGIILNFIYGWDRSNQSYLITELLKSGFGYWLYSYKNCSLYVQGFTGINYDDYITDLDSEWNIIGISFDERIDKQNLTVVFNDTNYTWQDAVNAGIIVNFVYKWDTDIQSYAITEVLEPGEAFWLYAYYPCRLHRSVS